MPVARAAVVPLLLLVGVVAWWLGPGFSIAAGLYFASNLAYTYGLKHQVILDVFIIALGFVLRAIAGVQLLTPVVPDIEISPWLLVCTFSARCSWRSGNAGESSPTRDGAARQRAVLEQYTPGLVDGLLLVSAAASVMGYALYTIGRHRRKFGNEAMLYTCRSWPTESFATSTWSRPPRAPAGPPVFLVNDRPLAAQVRSTWSRWC